MQLSSLWALGAWKPGSRHQVCSMAVKELCGFMRILNDFDRWEAELVGRILGDRDRSILNTSLSLWTTRL